MIDAALVLSFHRWNYFYTNAISVPVEISAAGILLTFWDKDVSYRSGLVCVFTAHFISPPLDLASIGVYGGDLYRCMSHKHFRCTMVRRVRILLLDHQKYVRKLPATISRPSRLLIFVFPSSIDYRVDHHWSRH